MDNENRYRIRLKFTKPLLGTAPKDRQIYASYMLTKAAAAGVVLSDGRAMQELEAIEQSGEERGATGFHTNRAGPFVYGYVIKGLFKEACGTLARVEGTRSKALKAYKKIIDGLLFVEPDEIEIQLSGRLEVLERPLRASTAQGERIALTRSDCAPVGSALYFDLVLLGSAIDQPLLTEWLNYGSYRGLGQWRNAGYGRFTYTMERA